YCCTCISRSVYIDLRHKSSDCDDYGCACSSSHLRPYCFGGTRYPTVRRSISVTTRWTRNGEKGARWPCTVIKFYFFDDRRTNRYRRLDRHRSDCSTSSNSIWIAGNLRSYCDGHLPDSNAVQGKCCQRTINFNIWSSPRHGGRLANLCWVPIHLRF